MAQLARVIDNQAVTVPEEESKAVAEVSSDFRDLLAGYAPQSENGQPDIVEDRYRILLNDPLPQFSTTLAEAFEVQDLAEEFSNLYAIILPPHLPVRMEAIEALKIIVSPSLPRCYGHQPVYLSTLRETRFAVILQRPEGVTLTQTIKQHGPLTDRVVILNILKPICEALSKLHGYDINHGTINPDRIYVGQNVMLGECISEPSGYSQKTPYLPPNQIGADPCGKAGGDITSDLYALGVVSLYVTSGGKLPVDGMSREELHESLLQEGCYNSFVKSPDLSVNLLDFCQGVLTKSQYERWNTETALSCLGGKRYNLIPPSPPKDTTRSFQFEGKDHYSLAALSHSIAKGWPEARIKLDIAGLSRWLDRGVADQDVADLIALTLPDPLQFEVSAKPIKDLELTKAIAILDPSAPMRMKDMAFHADAMGAMLADSFHEGNNQHIQLICKIIQGAIPKFVSELVEDDIDPLYAQMLWSIQNAKALLNNPNDLGMGPERMLYKLNPSLPCQTSYMQGYYADSIRRVLTVLDELAPTQMARQPLLDKHLAAFLCNKLDANRPVRIVELSKYNDFANDKRLVMLKILSQAQKKIGNPPLKGLTIWAIDMIMPIIEKINNVAMRKKIIKDLKKIAENGVLEQVAFKVFNPDIIGKDHDAFQTVIALCGHHRERIAFYRDEKNIRLNSRERGRSLSIFFSYLVLGVTAFFVFKPLINL